MDSLWERMRRPNSRVQWGDVGGDGGEKGSWLMVTEEYVHMIFFVDSFYFHGHEKKHQQQLP